MSEKENKKEEQVNVKEEPKKKKSKILRSKKDKNKEKIAELEAQIAESKDKFLRLFAEFENFKKRNIRERLELMSTASQETIKDLLPVLDDFDRAKHHADDPNSQEVFSDGVTMVYNKINKVLSDKGLKAMETNGEAFDPELHEAITEIPAPNDEMKGKIIDTIEKGYYLKEKIIRHARVVVGK